jgi:hypothetical protein
MDDIQATFVETLFARLRAQRLGGHDPRSRALLQHRRVPNSTIGLQREALCTRDSDRGLTASRSRAVVSINAIYSINQHIVGSRRSRILQTDRRLSVFSSVALQDRKDRTFSSINRNTQPASPPAYASALLDFRLQATYMVYCVWHW